MMPLLGTTIGDWRREAGLESCGGSVGQECRLVRVELLVAVIGAHRVVVGVGIILKRRVADAEASANYSLFDWLDKQIRSRGAK